MIDTTEWMDGILKAVDEFVEKNNDDALEEKTLDVDLSNNAVVELLRLKLPIQKNKRWVLFEDEIETAKRIRVPVLMITNITINLNYRKQGYFTRFIDRLYTLLWEKYKRVIYLECIIEQDWFDYLYNNTDRWYKVMIADDSLLYIPNLEEIKDFFISS